MKNLTSVLITLGWMLFALTPVYSAEIAVDEECSLADAIRAANADMATGDCPAGDGADVITLSANVTLDAELPSVATEISIEGGGFSISGEGAFRIFFVEASAKLTIERLTLLDGKASEVPLESGRTIEAGGAIFNLGNLHVSGSRFADNSGEDGGAILNAGELNISDSVFSDNLTEDDGGAIYSFGSLSISDSTFSGNIADDDGGAIYNLDRATISDSTFLDNEADRDGGAIHNYGMLSIDGSAMADNSADCGGAIYNRGELNVRGSSFTRNSAYYEGGAVYNGAHYHSEELDVSISGSTFSGNSASVGGAIFNEEELGISVSNSTFSINSSYVGGAVNNLGKFGVAFSTFTDNVAGTGGAINNGSASIRGELSVNYSVFSANAATGGGAIQNHGELAIVSSQFGYNSAQWFGGALASIGALSVSNSTFFNNTADKIDDSSETDDAVEAVGGSLFVFGTEENRSIVSLTHVTFARDMAEGKGDSIYVEPTDFAIVNVRNSIIAGNTGAACSGPLEKSMGNLIEDGSCESAFSGDPMLGEPVEPEDGSPVYFPLLPGSPAIDAAISDFCPESDQVGAPRPQGAACDIGAIEYVSQE